MLESQIQQSPLQTRSSRKEGKAIEGFEHGSSSDDRFIKFFFLARDGGERLSDEN